MRLGLTTMVLGASTLSLQAWLTNRYTWRTAGFVAAAALARASLVILFVLAIAVIVIALRPKRTVYQALLVIASSNIVFGVVTARPHLALTGGVSLSLLLAARSLWGSSATGGRAAAGA